MLKAEELTYKIRGAIFEVFRQLGAGFLEKVYENALMIELHNCGLQAVSQLTPIHEAQLLNDLKATQIEIGLLVNFTHPKAVIKRLVY